MFYKTLAQITGPSCVYFNTQSIPLPRFTIDGPFTTTFMVDAVVRDSQLLCLELQHLQDSYTPTFSHVCFDDNPITQHVCLARYLASKGFQVYLCVDEPHKTLIPDDVQQNPFITIFSVTENLFLDCNECLDDHEEVVIVNGCPDKVTDGLLIAAFATPAKILNPFDILDYRSDYAPIELSNKAAFAHFLERYDLLYLAPPSFVYCHRSNPLSATKLLNRIEQLGGSVFLFKPSTSSEGKDIIVYQLGEPLPTLSPQYESYVIQPFIYNGLFPYAPVASKIRLLVTVTHSHRSSEFCVNAGYYESAEKPLKDERNRRIYTRETLLSSGAGLCQRPLDTATLNRFAPQLAPLVSRLYSTNEFVALARRWIQYPMLSDHQQYAN